MMPKELIDVLNVEQPQEFHNKLLTKCKDLVRLSRDRMQTYYNKWDKYDMVFRGEKYRDMQDVKAAERKEPEKMVVPMTYAQVMTFVAFMQQLYTQRPTFFELEGTGAESAQAAKVAEAVLEYNLDHNNFKGEKLQQFLLNIARFGVGILKHSWVEETIKVEEEVPQQLSPEAAQLGIIPPTTKQLVDKVVYQGNKIVNVSPYRFFPDPRIPLTRFQEGEFCASEDEYSEHQLKVMESKQMVAGLKYVPKFTVDMLYDGARRVSFGDAIQNTAPGSELRQPFFYVITEVQIDLIPSEWEVNGKKLGLSDQPEKYIVWYANDSRIIRVEPMGYLHSKFTYDLSQFSNDNIRYINFGISEVLEQMQDVQTWFINSHITSVRKVISNYLIVDPKGIEIKDLQDRNPVIRLKPTAQGSGVDRWIKQLNVQDVTQNHVADAQVMEKFAQQATGITENLLGQFASGRRSAQEARNVNSNAAARLVLTGVSIWETAIKPLGINCLSNCRDGMTVEQLVKVMGQSNFQNLQQGVGHFLGADQQPPMVNNPIGGLPPLAPKPLAGFMMVNKDMLVGNYDFLPFDGTLPSARGAIAQALQEVFQLTLEKPELAFVLQIDPTVLFYEILELRGIRNPDRFRLTPDAAQRLIGLASAARNAATNVTNGVGGQPAQGGGNQQMPPRQG